MNMDMKSTVPDPAGAAWSSLSPGPSPRLAIIIPHYNDVARLLRCLKALQPQLAADVELVVVDNASTVSLDPVRACFPDLRLIVETEKGAAPARNRGIAETTAPLLAFIDSDCLPADDWVEMARVTAEGGDGDLFGGRVDVFDETPPPRSGAEAFEAVFAFNFRDYIERQGFTGAGNLVTRRDVFDAAGGFVNGVSEDREWSMRAVSRGFRLRYVDGLVVSHPSRSDWPALRRKWLRLTQETYELDGRGARLRWALRALAMPISAIVHLPKVLMSPRLSGPAEKWRAALTLFRLRLLRMVWMLKQATGASIR